MSEEIGYIQRRSRTITPEQQEKEMKLRGIEAVFDSLDDVLSPATLREGDTLVVWSMGIIGRVNIHKAFLAVANVSGKGIYSMKANRLYPAELPHAQTIHDAYDEMTEHENLVRSEATKGKSGRQPSKARENDAEIKALAADGVHLGDLAIRFKCSESTIRRILATGRSE